jgi:K+-transporting ATPase ATPase A chain
MSPRDYLQVLLFLGILLASAKPLGLFMQKVFNGEKTFLHPILGKLEFLIYKFCGINPEEDQDWTVYAGGLMGISFVTCMLTYLILKLQGHLPLNPQHLPDLSSHLAFNTAISFTTNTNWQNYGGEGTMSYLSQMVALTFHNFISAAVGIAVAVALIRGLAKKESRGIGNFWADLVRCNLYILLPASFALAIFYISQGMIQTFAPYLDVTTLEGAKQTIALGPVASQVAIKMLGTNGGGFFNSNASHPFENPTSLSNFVQMLTIFLIPSALVYQLGRTVKNVKHGWSVWGTMALLFVVGVLVCAHFEYQGQPKFSQMGLSSLGNMEGKETRFGIFNSALFATVTTDASCGAVNSMHDSFTPMGGLVPLANIMFGEIIFGGVGSGLYGMLIFVILTVFIAGLMVGRTPEYLGKKIEAREVQLVMIAMIIMVFTILVMSAVGVLSKDGLAAIANTGPHGFTEILYAYTSQVGNNGSAFGGLSGNTPFWNITGAFAMFFGRFLMMIPMLAVAGSMARKKIHPGGEGSFPVHGGIFIGLLLGVIVLVGALTFFPALTLGPILEHFEMLNGKIF